MGKVIELHESSTQSDVRLPPPRRVTDEALRSPIITSRPLPIGDAVSVYGLHQLASVARRWVREYAGRPAEEAETLALLTTELFANAVRHSRSGQAGGEVIVIVSQTGLSTQVKVVDDGPCVPGARPRLRDVDVAAGEGEDGGFGLRLLDAMSTRWGVLYEDGRTTVWFDIDRDRR